VFVSDPSAEAERIAQALRGEGYVVVDVPLSMLVARVAVQRPRVILVDAGDAEAAIETIARVREVEGSDAIEVVFLGDKSDPIAEEGAGFFARPVDVAALSRKVDELTGGARRFADEETSTSVPHVRAAAASLPPPSMRAPEIRGQRATPAPPSRASVPLLDLGSAAMRRPTGASAPLSGELESLLSEAEQRIGGQLGQSESMLPSPEEEIEAVLPAEVLASLDEPLEDDEDDAALDAGAAALHRGNTTGAGRITTGNSTGAGSTGAGGRTPENATRGSAPRATSTAESLPPAKTTGGTFAGTPGTTGASNPGASIVAPPPAHVDVFEKAATTPPPMTSQERAAAPQARPAPTTPATVLGPADAPRVLGSAIAARASGVMAFTSPAGVRRVAMKDGDVVTASSSIEDETLLPFLAARGELPRDRVAQLAGKVPGFGRHAGAALVAHGYLRQDQLWAVLRAHAEWILGRVVVMDTGTGGFEDEPPARVKAEPSVFGGSTGGEVFVEVVRRVIAPGDAVARLGGEGARVADGAHAALARECALGAAETEWLARARAAKTLSDALASAADPDFASVLYALVALGVFDAIRPIGAPPPRPPASGRDVAAASDVDALDEEAIRARVRARLQLVDEGDYFAVLGVSRDATSYEVRRAFLELRRTFEPSRLLTPALADLRDDVQKIATVLDEAYEILRDGARRERYRRAIDATPR
jgi:hypothetical protein